MIWALLLMGIICFSLSLLHQGSTLRRPPAPAPREEEPMECNVKNSYFISQRSRRYGHDK